MLLWSHVQQSAICINLSIQQCFQYIIPEPEITVHSCPDKMSDQILKYGQTLLQICTILKF